VLSVINNEGVEMHSNDLNRTSIRNIVLKSSFSHLRGAKLNFAHINPGSAVPHIEELNAFLN
jgi:hypothetical protein